MKTRIPLPKVCLGNSDNKLLDDLRDTMILEIDLYVRGGDDNGVTYGKKQG